MLGGLTFALTEEGGLLDKGAAREAKEKAPPYIPPSYLADGGRRGTGWAKTAQDRSDGMLIVGGE